ncbi:hypothetical protein GGS23DRAFT_292135 [Durotheca rogersii]|uniref:uncharacterized protein n=1 Tax=Durotheca rogersii TaxID=419775 RepID=UPI00221EE580|nr:uncharacterized protein GGS23DRAFT_292135 [Durotheca rogersii]KAI5866849.1 hypothetical protein GGS23DRAFT_292135 [Durotheca rogersii]
MGNICGKADSDHFAQPGRVLGATPPQPERAAVPARVVGGPPRTLGGTRAPSSRPNPAPPQGGGANADEARRRAAEAAERRAQASMSKPVGKLGTQLAAQKKQTRNETLNELSRDETRRRDADEAAEARNHN